MIVGARRRLGLAALGIGLVTVLGIVGLRLGGASAVTDTVVDRPVGHDAGLAGTAPPVVAPPTQATEALLWTQRRRSHGAQPNRSPVPSLAAASATAPSIAAAEAGTSPSSPSSLLSGAEDQSADSPLTSALLTEPLDRPVLSPVAAPSALAPDAGERFRRRGGGSDPFAIGPWCSRPQQGLLDRIDAVQAVDAMDGSGAGGASTWFKKPPLDADG